MMKCLSEKGPSIVASRRSPGVLRSLLHLCPMMTLSLCISLLGTGQAQGEETSPELAPVLPHFIQTFDFAIGAAAHEYTAALSLHTLYGFGSSRRLKVGLGTRFFSFFGGDNLGYTTAEASLISSNLVNTLNISGAQTNSLNATFHINYNLIAGLVLGFNIDLIGVGFGNSRSGAQPASTSSFNILLGGKADRGQLDSEFFAAYEFTDHLTVRGGLSHLSSEYTTSAKPDNGNNRYRHSTTLPFIAVSYRL